MAGTELNIGTTFDPSAALKALGLENMATDLAKAIATEIGKHFSEIAALFGLSPQQFTAANPQVKTDAQGNVENGQKLNTGSAVSAYTVKSGDNLTRIAAQNGVSLASLIAANPQIANPNRIKPGEVLTVPSASTAAGGKAAQKADGTAAATGTAGGTYTPNAQALRTADVAQANAGAKSQGMCYKWVKQSLLKSGAVSDFIPGVAAKGAGPELEKRGFVNIMGRNGSNIRSPYDAPPGAVLVYGAASNATDKNAKYGHIEIRTRTGFASDYSSTTARTGSAANGTEGRGRVLIGVYIKPSNYTQSAGGQQSAGAPASTSAAGQTTAAGAGAARAGSGMSTAGINKLYDREAVPGVSNHLHWPKFGSGVTLGAGYDMKGKTRAEVVKDLTAIGISRSAAETAAGGVGLSGQAAKNFAAANKNTINLTPAQEKALLKNEVASFEKVVKDSVKVPLTQNQFDALVSFSFNIGKPGFAGDANHRASTTLTRLNQGDYKGAAEAMKLWNKSGGQVVQGLINRRNSEVNQFNSASAPMASGQPTTSSQAAPATKSASAAATPPAADRGSYYAGLIAQNGDKQAQADFAAGKKVVIAVRTDTSTNANNKQGVYDDKMVIVQKTPSGKISYLEFKGNTEPAGRYEAKGYGKDINGDGRKELGRLVEGTYRYSMKPGNFVGNRYFEVSRTQVVQRDTNHDGKFTAADGIDRAGAGTTMYIHQGGVNGTGSAGCQTMPPAEYNRFLNALGNQTTFSYVLMSSK